MPSSLVENYPWSSAYVSKRHRFCLVPLPLGVWEGLRFVIVALSGLFSYPFFKKDCADARSYSEPLLFQYAVTASFQ